MSVDPYSCENCGKRGKWRQGVYFENEMRCPSCNTTWEPNKRIHDQQEVFETQSVQTVADTTISTFIECLDSLGEPSSFLRFGNSKGAKITHVKSKSESRVLVDSGSFVDNHMMSVNHRVNISKEEEDIFLQALGTLAAENPSLEKKLRKMASQVEGIDCQKYTKYKNNHLSRIVDLPNGNG